MVTMPGTGVVILTDTTHTIHASTLEIWIWSWSWDMALFSVTLWAQWKWSSNCSSVVL